MKALLALTLIPLFAHADEAPRSLRPPQTRAEAIALMNDAGQDYASAQSHHARMAELAGRMGQLGTQAAGSAIAAANAIAALAQGGGSQQQLLDATKQLKETQMSFNLQYLQLQSQLQSENRAYVAVSNLMKTKHDTVKNSINNIR